MDVVAIKVAWISLFASVTACITSFVMWFLKRKVIKSDAKDENEKLQDKRLKALEAGQLALGKTLNDIATIQKMTVDGVSYVVDGLETNGILNGTGKKYLEDINDYYKQKGFEALKFHSFEGTRPSSSKKKKEEE